MRINVYPKIILLSILLLAFLTFVASVTLARESPPSNSGCYDEVCLKDPLGYTTPDLLLGTMINTVLGLVGSIALAMFIYGGFMWMTSSGNSEKVEKGKNILIWATLGLVVIFSAYAMVKFVFTGIGVTR